jgi:site-specific recombinase XerD
LLKHGESVAVVSQLLGHANASMTLNRYAHVLPDQRKGRGHAHEQAARRLTPNLTR